MHDIYFNMPLEKLRNKMMRVARERYPNFNAMPDEMQIDCLADMLDDGLCKLLKRNAAMRQHSEAYENFLDV
jgi:hypothetical protein